MSDQTSRLTVEVNQVSKGTGLTDVSKGLKGVTQDATAAARAAQANAKGVNELGEASEKGAAAGRVLSGALQGDIASLGQLGVLLKSFGQLLKTNVIGLLITLGALAASFAIPFIKGFTDTTKAAKATEDQLKLVDKATDEAKKSAEELGKAQMDVLIQNLDTIKRTAAEADDSFKSILARAQQLDDAQRTLDLAKIDTDKTLTDEQKVARRAAVTTRFDARRASRPLAEAQERVQSAAEVKAGTTSQLQQANEQAIAAQARVNELNGGRAQLEADRSRILAEYRARDSEIVKNTPDGYGRQGELRKNLEQTNTKLRPISEQLDIYNSPEGKARDQQAATALEEATKRRNAAQAEQQKADAELIRLEKELAAAREQQAKLIPLITEAARLKTAQDLEDARTRDIAAGRTANVTPSAPAPAAGIPTITGGGAGVNPNDPADAARQRIAALASVAGGQAAAKAGNVNLSPAEQTLAAKIQEAATAVQKNSTLEAVNKLIDLMLEQGAGQSELAKRIRDLETNGKTARTR